LIRSNKASGLLQQKVAPGLLTKLTYSGKKLGERRQMVAIEKPRIYIRYKIDKCGRGKPLSLNLTLMYVWCLNSNRAAKLI